MATVSDQLRVEELEARYVRCQDATASFMKHLVWEWQKRTIATGLAMNLGNSEIDTCA